MRRRGFAVLPLALAALAVAEVAVFVTVVHLLGGLWAIRRRRRWGIRR